MMAGAWANGPALSACPRLTYRMNSRLCTRAPTHLRTRAPLHLCTSENVFDAELHDAAVFRAGNLAEWRRADDAIGLAEARLVPDVEAFDAHLDAMVSGEVEALEHRKIRSLESGAADAVAAGVAGALAGFRQRQHPEAGGVEVLRGGLRAVVGIAGDIGTRRHIADVEHRALGHGEREPGLCLVDAIQLPAAGKGAYDRRGAFKIGQRVTEAHDKTMAGIEERRSLLEFEGLLDACIIALRDRQDRPRLTADIETGDVIGRLAERVAGEEVETARRQHAQAGL